jgi:aspartate carbamoyltransferase regulatory subunit
LKKVALISPEPTINYIKNGKIREKFVYLLCGNPNCITRTVTEDVPPKFYYDGSDIRCRYCRRPYSVLSRKVSADELGAYVRSLPAGIEPVLYRG